MKLIVPDFIPRTKIARKIAKFVREIGTGLNGSGMESGPRTQVTAVIRVPSVLFLFSGCLRQLCRKFHSVTFQFTPLDLNTYRCFKRALTSLSEIWQRLSSSLV